QFDDALSVHHDPTAPDRLFTSVEAKRFGDVVGRHLARDGEAVTWQAIASRFALCHWLDVVGRTANLAPDLSDGDATTLAGVDQSGSLKQAQRLLDRRVGDAVVLHQRRGRRQRVAGRELTRLDLRSKVIRYSLIHGLRIVPVSHETPHPRSPCRYSRLEQSAARVSASSG